MLFQVRNTAVLSWSYLWLFKVGPTFVLSWSYVSSKLEIRLFQVGVTACILYTNWYLEMYSEMLSNFTDTFKTNFENSVCKGTENKRKGGIVGKR